MKNYWQTGFWQWLFYSQCFFLVLVCRLFVIQIVQGQSHKEDFTYKEKTVKTSGTRGNIYDCNGKLLAYNKMVYTVNFRMTINSKR